MAMLMNKRLCVNTGIFQLLLLSPASILGIGKLIALTQGIVNSCHQLKESEKAQFLSHTGLDKSLSYVKMRLNNQSCLILAEPYDPAHR